MSYYTNDIDTLRQLISQSMPQLLSSGVMVITVFGIMLYYSLWMSLVIVAGVIIMLRVIKKLVATRRNTLSVSRNRSEGRRIY